MQFYLFGVFKLVYIYAKNIDKPSCAVSHHVKCLV